VDAHSMLPASEKLQAQGTDCVRFATTDAYDLFLSEAKSVALPVYREQAVEESFFLGLRLNRGIDLAPLREKFGERISRHLPVIDELVSTGLLLRQGDNIQLTPRGRLLSNEVFERFIHDQENPVPALLK
jgi:oxygen-independent coproporphyrinogen III oxidase